ncbi:MAG: hypothetical protein KDC79_14375, partial [Cyclobacteriaceae bacterium]|nr:hypothetical protein [Cyclobacteriaceae bacterium]
MQLLKRYFIFFLAFLASFYANAQVSVTAATGGENICLNSGPATSDYYSLSDIVVTETNPTDFDSPNANRTFTLGFSSGSFEFEAGIGNLTVSGAGIGTNSISVTSSSITVTLAIFGPSDASINSFTISGINVRATAAGTAEIRRTGGSQIINGDAIGDAKNHGTLVANNPPVASLSDDKGSVICSSELITFTAAPGGATNYEFIFDPGGVRTTLQSGASEFYSTSSLSNGDQVSVIVTDSNGCSDESSASLITVNPGFTASISSSAAANTSCDGESVTFTAAYGGAPTLPVSYEFFVNGVVAQAASPDDTYDLTTLNDGDEVYAIIQESGTCSATTNTITQTIVPLPSTGLSVIPTNSTVCYGETAEITVGSSELNVNYQLKDISDNVLSSSFPGTGSNLVLTSTALTSNLTIKVVASSSLTTNCSVDLTDTEAITVQSSLPPTSTSPVPICEGDAVPSLTASGTGGTYKWYDDVALTNLVGTGSPYTPTGVVDENTPGTYRLYVTDTDAGCESAGTAVDVVVNALPNTGLTVSPAAVSVCENTTTTIQVQSSENNVNYRLYNGATPMSAVYVGNGGNLDLTTYALTSNVTLTIKATTPNLCTDNLSSTTAITVDVTPTSVAGSDDETCADQATYTVSGTSSSNGTILWTSSSGGSFVDATV